MQIAREFKSPPSGVLENFHKKALITLSSPSVPESAREEAIERAESGEKITHEKAKELADAHKLIKEQADEIRKREEQMSELLDQIGKLRSQLPTEDVKKQIDQHADPTE